jgi:hypothetical protein
MPRQSCDVIALSWTLLLRRRCFRCSWIDQFLRLGLDPSRLEELRSASLLHDAFQIGVIIQRTRYDLIEAFDIP